MKKPLYVFLLILVVNILLAQPCPSITSFSVTPPSCFGLANGCIEINYTAGTAPYTVIWSSPLPQTISSSLSQSVCGVPSGAYSATVTDNNGCVTSQAVLVSQPSSFILMTSPNTTMCYGQTTQIAAFCQGGTPPYTYSWTPSFIGSGPHSVNPASNTTYSVNANDANGCSVSTKIITVNVTPPLAAVGFLITSCENSVVVLSPIITSPGSGGPYTYNWSNGAVNTSSILVNATMPSPNLYSVSIDDGCTVPSAVAIFTVNVNPLPSAGISISAISGCAPLTTTLIGLSNGVNDIFSWSESINGNIGSGNPLVYTFQNAGNFDVNLLVTNSITGCSNMTNVTGITINVCAGFQEISKDNIISVFPNPSNGLLHFLSDDNIKQIEITDYAGRLLSFELVNSKSHRISLQNIAEGIYFVKISFSDGTSITKKVIKQN